MVQSIFEIEHEQHQEIEQRLNSNLSAIQRNQLNPNELALVLNRLRDHMLLEESVLLPSAQKVPGTEQMIGKVQRQHQEMSKTLSRLLNEDEVQGKHLYADVERLRDLFQDHEHLLDDQLLPSLKQNWKSEFAEAMGREWIGYRDVMAKSPDAADHVNPKR